MLQRAWPSHHPSSSPSFCGAGSCDHLRKTLTLALPHHVLLPCLSNALLDPERGLFLEPVTALQSTPYLWRGVLRSHSLANLAVRETSGSSRSSSSVMVRRLQWWPDHTKLLADAAWLQSEKKQVGSHVDLFAVITRGTRTANWRLLQSLLHAKPFPALSMPSGQPWEVRRLFLWLPTVPVVRVNKLTILVPKGANSAEGVRIWGNPIICQI